LVRLLFRLSCAQLTVTSLCFAVSDPPLPGMG
jgi:hypothetical protein